MTTRGALTSWGVSRATVTRRVRSGRWSEPVANVIVLPGPEDFRRSVLICCFACGPTAVASHETAAHLHGLLDSPRPDQVSVTLPWEDRGRARGPGSVTISRRMLPSDRLQVGGVPLASVAWTLDDIVRLRGERDGAFAIGDALRRGLVRRDTLLEVAFRRPDSRVPELLADVLATDVERAESAAEVRAVVLLFPELRRRGLPVPILQYEVRDGWERLVARVDAGWPSHRVALEVHSKTYHATRSAQDHDGDRADDLSRCAWRVVFATPTEIRQRPAAVVDRIARALSEAASRPRSSALFPGQPPWPA